MVSSEAGSTNGREMLFAVSNGVVVWKSPERPLVKLCSVNRGDPLTVVAKLRDNWLQVELADGTPGFMQSSAVTATQYVAPPPAPMQAPAAVAPQPAAPSPAPASAAPQYVAAAPSPQPAATPHPPAPSPSSAPVAAAVHCGSCGRPRIGDAAFCAGCGAPITVQAVGAQPSAVAAPAGNLGSFTQMSAPTLLNRGYLIYAGLNLALIISAFMPWEKTIVQDYNGLAVNRGWFVLLAAFVAGGMACLAAFSPRGVPFLRHAQIAAGVVAIAMAGFEVNLTGSNCSGQDAANNLLGTCLETSMGIGPIFAAVFALALIIFAVVKHPKRQVTTM